MGAETRIDQATLTVVWHGLQRICRVPLAAEFAPDLDDLEESGEA